jgi:hypothetical protein
MAGDFIMVEFATRMKPEVLRIAHELDIHPAFAFGLCINAWMWFDEQTEDGHAVGVTVSHLDSIVAHKGFSDALRNVGWLQVRDGSLAIPNFDRLMGESAKTRGKNAIRKRKQRAKEEAENVTESSQNGHKKTRPKAREKGISYSNRDSPRSDDLIDLSATDKMLRDKLGKPKSAADVRFFSLVGKAIEERRISEAILSASIVGCEKAHNRIAMFRSAMQVNVRDAGGDFEELLNELDGAKNDN